jgi:hypothetical protein
MIDRYYINNPEAWDPRTVNSMGPDVDLGSLDGISDQLLGKAQTRVVSIATSALEVGLLAIALTVWLQIGRPTNIGPFKPGPGWYELFAPIAVVTAFSLLNPIVTLLQPSWTRFRVAGHVVVYAATIVIGAVSLGLANWVLLVDPATATADIKSTAELINSIVRVSIAITIVFTGVNLALELRRLVRMRRA